MRITIAALLLSLCIISFILPAHGGEKTLTLPELRKCRIIGELGKPLGTVVVIVAVVVDDSHRRLKSDEGALLLKVEKVDEKKIIGESIIRIQHSPFVSIRDPKPGERFSLIGYETGAFTGIPGKAFTHIPRVATTEFQFETHFEAIKECSR